MLSLVREKRLHIFEYIYIYMHIIYNASKYVRFYNILRKIWLPDISKCNKA